MRGRVVKQLRKEFMYLTETYNIPASNRNWRRYKKQYINKGKI